MPELPDIVVYIEALEKRILGETLEAVRIVSPFLLRTATPRREQCCWEKGPAPPQNWKTHLHRPRKRSLAGVAFDDRRALALARARSGDFATSQFRRI